MHYKKTSNLVFIFATSRLVTHFCCRQNMRSFANGECNSLVSSFFLFLIKVRFIVAFLVISF